MFARVRLVGSGPRPVILVPDAAIGSDQAEKFVWVVDDQKRAQYRRIHVGGMYEGLRIVRDGLTVNDRVIVARDAACSSRRRGRARGNADRRQHRGARGDAPASPPRRRRGEPMGISRFFIDRPIFAAVIWRSSR